MKKQILATLLGLAPLCLCGQGLPLPDPPAPFRATEGKRLDPELKVALVGSLKGPIPQPSFWLGNKRIGVREDTMTHVPDDHDQLISLRVDNKPVVAFTFYGGSPNSGVGYPFKLADGQQTKLDVDVAAKTITYAKPYPLSGGRTGLFTYTLTGLKDGKVSLSWDMGADAATDKDAAVSLWMRFPGTYRTDGLGVDGNPVAFPDPSTLSKEYNKSTPVTRGSASQISYAPGLPLKGFSITFPAKTSYDLSESLTGAGEELKCQTGSGQKGSVVIDLGLSAVSSVPTPPPVAGIDFWQRDAMTVALPPGRNMLRNPGFEQGLRYWNWWWGGGRYDPSQPTAYSVSSDALFGGKSLEVRPYGGVLSMMSFPIPVTKGKTYTLSYYAKSETPGACHLAVVGMGHGTQYSWPDGARKQHYPTTPEWKRQSFTFQADTTGIQLMLDASTHTWFDGLQLEEGDQATDFVSPAVEGDIVTADPQNALEQGKPFGAKFVLSGKPGGSGQFELTCRDFYKAPVWTFKKSYQLDAKGAASFDLPLEKDLGTGSYVIQAQFQPDGADLYSDYFRLSVLKSMNSLQPTKTFFGNSFQLNITRADDLGKLYVRWGWGYRSYGFHSQEEADFCAKYHIDNWPSLVTYPPFAGFGYLTGDLIRQFNHAAFETDTVSDDDAKFIEETVYNVVKANPWNKSWALSTESEGHSKLLRGRKFDEYAKVLTAFWKGVKRANPEAKVYPDGGTSGFSDLRGSVEMKGYLAATQGKIKWDALAIHPYGTLDGVGGMGDLDIEIPKLLAIMKETGYGPETPIDIDECFDVGPWNIPEWETMADGYVRGVPTYDQGWQEFQQAAHSARTYLSLLKYWPQLRSANIWQSRPFIDQNLAPLAFCLTTNALANLFPNPRFKADIRPAAGVRGYAFEDEKGDCTAALWCTIDKVDEGYERGPEIGVKLNGLAPQVIDLMGNARKLPAAEDGATSIRLSSAPLFFRVPQAQESQLIEALSKAEVTGVGNALRVSVLPTLDGSLEAKLENQTGNLLKGELLIQDTSVPFSLPPMKVTTQALPFSLPTAPGRITPWRQTIGVKFPNGKSDSIPWDMSSFTVPHVDTPLPNDPDAPEWKAIPAIALDNWVVRDPQVTPHYGYPGDLDATFQLAWDKDNLYLRVSAVDDHFVLADPAKWSPRQLYKNDGCVEVYLDTAASGRSNPNKGFDQYDYRYDFFAGSAKAESGPGSVYRLQEVFVQLAGGMAMPTKEQAAAGVKCEYRRTGNAYSYVIVLPQMYIEPMHLEKGWRAGFGLYIHDRDTDGTYPEKGLSLATKKGEPCNLRPDLWPILVLGQ